MDHEFDSGTSVNWALLLSYNKRHIYQPYLSSPEAPMSNVETFPRLNDYTSYPNASSIYSQVNQFQCRYHYELKLCQGTKQGTNCHVIDNDNA